MNPETFAAWVHGGWWALLIIAAVLGPPFIGIYAGTVLYRIARDLLYDRKMKKARRMQRLAKQKLRDKSAEWSG